MSPTDLEMAEVSTNPIKMVPLELFTKKLVIDQDLPLVQASIINVQPVLLHSFIYSFKSTLSIISISFCKYVALASLYDEET